MLNYNDKIGIVACSNPREQHEKIEITQLEQLLKSMNLEPVLSPHIYQNGKFSPTPKERGDALMNFYKDDSIKAIFDISGGDMANNVLDYLNFDIISKKPKTFWGYSDLTTIINAIFTKTGNSSYLYQSKNLVWDKSENQLKNFRNTIFSKDTSLHQINWNFTQGISMSGTIIGGNIRCFLKLAGTQYMPDFTDKLLFLESCGGEIPQISTFLYQLKQLGAFEKIGGLLLGTFTQFEKTFDSATLIELVENVVDNPNLPIAKTKNVGHSNDSKCLIIGKKYFIS